MNKIFFAIIVLVFTACAGGSEEGLKISGVAENVPNGGWVVIEEITETGNKPLDTAQVKSGAYSLLVTQPKHAFYTLNFNDRQKVTLVLDGSENEVEVNADGDEPRGFFEVSGSATTDHKMQMDEVMKAFQQELRSIQGQQMEARNNGDVKQFQEANQQIQQLALEAEAEIKNLIRKSMPSLASFYGIQMIQLDNNLSFVDSVATELATQLPDNYMIQELARNINFSKSLSVGAKAPEIELPNPDGELIALSSLRGKYVLIDFWAAWCKPCRAENPNVVRVYNQYADKNFEILGVSLDRTREAWLTAIEQDDLPWLHISDLKYWRSEAAQTYQIRAIPATYLIDPEGNIIAKNLRGSSLEAKLKEIFG